MKTKEKALAISNAAQPQITRISVEEREAEIPAPGGNSTYVQYFTVLTVGEKEVWLLPGQARELVKMLRV